MRAYTSTVIPNLVWPNAPTSTFGKCCETVQKLHPSFDVLPDRRYERRFTQLEPLERSFQLGPSSELLPMTVRGDSVFHRGGELKSSHASVRSSRLDSPLRRRPRRKVKQCENYLPASTKNSSPQASRRNSSRSIKNWRFENILIPLTLMWHWLDISVD